MDNETGMIIILLHAKVFLALATLDVISYMPGNQSQPTVVSSYHTVR